MKTTVVPAQVTTVEDRIAGNFTFSQIILLIIPLLIGTAIYVVAPPRLNFGSIKFIVMSFQAFILGSLAIRFRGKIIVEWLIIYLRFRLRPRKYVFTKNDLAGRDIAIKSLPQFKVSEKPVKEIAKRKYESLAPSDEARIGQLLDNPALSFSVKLAKKGGIDVSLKSNKD